MVRASEFGEQTDQVVGGHVLAAKVDPDVGANRSTSVPFQLSVIGSWALSNPGGQPLANFPCIQ